MSRLVRRILLALAGVAAATVLVLVGLYLAAQHEPSFYRTAMEAEPATLEEGSGQMLQRVTALASALKKEDHWEALFTAEQINGWLAVDMVKNHPNTLPPDFVDPRVTIDKKNVTFACRCKQAGVDIVLSLTVEPCVPETNVILVRIIRARAGLLPMPLAGVLEHFAQVARDMHLRLQWRRHASGTPVAVLSFPDAAEDRPVCVKELRLADGEIYVAGTTQPKKP